VSNKPQLEIAAKLLKVEPAALEKALTFRLNKIRGETIGAT
jgi:myosin heavy subunit